MLGTSSPGELHGKNYLCKRGECWELAVKERFTPGSCYIEMNDTGTVLISRYHVRR